MYLKSTLPLYRIYPHARFALLLLIDLFSAFALHSLLEDTTSLRLPPSLHGKTPLRLLLAMLDTLGTRYKLTDTFLRKTSFFRIFLYPYPTPSPQNDRNIITHTLSYHPYPLTDTFVDTFLSLHSILPFVFRSFRSLFSFVDIFTDTSFPHNIIDTSLAKPPCNVVTACFAIIKVRYLSIPSETREILQI